MPITTNAETAEAETAYLATSRCPWGETVTGYVIEQGRGSVTAPPNDGTQFVASDDGNEVYRVKDGQHELVWTRPLMLFSLPVAEAA